MSIESLAIILIALAAGSVVKGITGLGLPLVAMPVLAAQVRARARRGARGARRPARAQRHLGRIK
jgi:hypothetical protein